MDSRPTVPHKDSQNPWRAVPRVVPRVLPRVGPKVENEIPGRGPEGSKKAQQSIRIHSKYYEYHKILRHITKFYHIPRYTTKYYEKTTTYHDS